MVILYDNMPVIEVGVEFIQTEPYQQTLSLNVHIVSLKVSKHFTGKSYGMTALDKGGPKPILTSICLQYDIVWHSMLG